MQTHVPVKWKIIADETYPYDDRKSIANFTNWARVKFHKAHAIDKSTRIEPCRPSANSIEIVTWSKSTTNGKKGAAGIKSLTSLPHRWPRSFGPHMHEGACKIARHTDLGGSLVSGGKVTGLSEVAACRFLCLSFSPGRDRWKGKKDSRSHVRQTWRSALTYTRPLSGLSPSSLSVGRRSTGPPADRPTAFMFGRVEEERKIIA